MCSQSVPQPMPQPANRWQNAQTIATWVQVFIVIVSVSLIRMKDGRICIARILVTVSIKIIAAQQSTP